jgi:hypothetical protein
MRVYGLRLKLKEMLIKLVLQQPDKIKALQRRNISDRHTINAHRNKTESSRQIPQDICSKYRSSS